MALTRNSPCRILVLFSYCEEEGYAENERCGGGGDLLFEYVDGERDDDEKE